MGKKMSKPMRWSFNVFLTPMTDEEIKRCPDDPWAQGYTTRLAYGVSDAATKARIPNLADKNLEIALTYIFPAIPKHGRKMTESNLASILGLSQAGLFPPSSPHVHVCSTGLINPADPRVIVTIQECDDIPYGCIDYVDAA